MKYMFILAVTLCTFSASMAQQATASSEVASANKATIKEDLSGQLYLLSTGDKTSEITKAEFKKIKKKDIEYVKVIRDPALLNMYGDKAKKGVILVLMKDHSNPRKNRRR